MRVCHCGALLESATHKAGLRDLAAKMRSVTSYVDSGVHRVVVEVFADEDFRQPLSTNAATTVMTGGFDRLNEDGFIAYTRT